MSNAGKSGGGLAGRRAGGDKSNFSLTCSLLSQYLKEKGSLADLSFGVMSRPLDLDAKAKPDPPRTMNLFPGIAAAAAAAAADKSSTSEDTVAASSAPTEEAKKKGEVKVAQMTMFYGGKVIVFDDFPADKAEELMAMATKGSTFDQTTLPAAAAAVVPANLPVTPAALAKPVNSLHPPPPPKAVVSTAPSGNKPAAAVVTGADTAAGAQDRPQAPATKPPLPIGSDLPIARRNSLNRFLEKRKGRISSLAPYQVNGPPDTPTSSSDTAPGKPDEKEKQKQPWFAPSSSGPSPSRSEEKMPWFGFGSVAPSKPEEKKQQPSWLGLGPMTPIEVPESPERQRR